MDRGSCSGSATPLLHMVRNALSHGLESAKRALHREPATGRITLRSTVQGSLVEVTIRDDRRGLDLGRSRDARELGLPEAKHRREIAAYVFTPGCHRHDA